MSQTSFLTVVCDRTKPPPQTADADCIAIESSTEKRYLCKSVKRHPMLPATEWICASLARAVGIPVADWVVVEVQGHTERMFGSVWEGGGQKDVFAALPQVTNGGIFSDTFAFDLTVHNVDRHLANYLYLDLAGDIVAKLIDASRAFIYHSIPIPLLPMEPDSKTMICKPYWEQFHPYQKPRGLAIAQSIRMLPQDWMKETCASMPTEWLAAPDLDVLDTWWRTERSNRMTAVEQEL
jgi:hypothetical protein